METVNPDSWGSWEHKPQTHGASSPEADPLMLRATREEAAAKGWDLTEAEEMAATHVAVAERVRWEASARPLGYLVARSAAEK